MVRWRYTEKQIIAVLREGEVGVKVADLCRKYGMSDAPISPPTYSIAGRSPDLHPC